MDFAQFVKNNVNINLEDHNIVKKEKIGDFILNRALLPKKTLISLLIAFAVQESNSN